MSRRWQVATKSEKLKQTKMNSASIDRTAEMVIHELKENEEKMERKDELTSGSLGKRTRFTSHLRFLFEEPLCLSVRFCLSSSCLMVSITEPPRVECVVATEFFLQRTSLSRDATLSLCLLVVLLCFEPF